MGTEKIPKVVRVDTNHGERHEPLLSEFVFREDTNHGERDTNHGNGKTNRGGGGIMPTTIPTK